MYSDFRSFNPEGERLLVLTLAGKLTRERSESGSGGLRKLVKALRPARPQTPTRAADTTPPCGDTANPVPVTR